MNWSKMGHFHLQYERFFLASLWACCSEKQKFWHKLDSVSCTHIFLKKNPAYSAMYSLWIKSKAASFAKIS